MANHTLKALLVIALAGPAFVTDALADPKGALTRKGASDLLNRHLAKPHVTMFEFNKGGIERAEQDGLVQRVGVPAFPQWAFTAKGLGMVGSHIGQNVIATPLGGGANPRFQFRTGIPQRVVEITGIADGPTPSYKQVEYRTEYIFPPSMAALGNYVYSGTYGARTNFQKYDDGWRVTQ